MIKINGRIMQEKLKRGWTTSRFAERFQVSEEEFLEFLQKNFSSKAYAGMLSYLKKNEKKTTQKSHTVVGQEEIPTPTENFDVVSEEACDSSPLDILKSRIKALEIELNQKELEHKTLVENRLLIRKSLSKFEEELKKLKTRIGQCKSELESLLLKHEEVYQQMQSVNSEISETKRVIKALQEEIKEAERITIFVYKSGDFDFESPYDIDISDSWESIYKKIRDNVDLETLTVKDIKVLAKCVAYAKKLESQNMSFDIIFENGDLETFFNALKKY